MFKKLVCVCAVLLCISNISVSETLYPARKNGQWGYINSNGEFVIEPKWDYASLFRAQKYAVVQIVDDEDEFNCIIDRDGEYVVDRVDYIIEAEYGYWLGDKDNGIFILGSEDDHMAFIDVHSGFISTPEYDFSDEMINNTSNLLQVVSPDNGMAGYVNRLTGELQIPYLYDPKSSYLFVGSVCIVTDPRNGAVTVINHNNQIIDLPEGYQVKCTEALNDRIRVFDTEQQKYGFVDVNGKSVIPCIYDDISLFYDELACAERDGEYYCINKNGKELFPLPEWCEFYNGYAILPDSLTIMDSNGDIRYIEDSIQDDAAFTPFDKDGYSLFFDDDENVGVIDATGRIIWDSFNYCKLGDSFFVTNDPLVAGHYFSDGLLLLENEDGLFGYIDINGNIIIPFRYDAASAFVEGQAIVFENDRMGYINTEGDYIWLETVDD